MIRLVATWCPAAHYACRGWPRGSVNAALSVAAVALAAVAGAEPDATALYARLCAPCHGVEGRGDGEGAYMLVSPPRNFHAAQYRFVSTWERTPTDDDLFDTITRGLPGSQMPSWATAPEADRRALVALLKSFADRPWTTAPSRAPDAAGRGGAGVIVVPPEPADSRTNRARGEELFRDACAPCHGPTGRGDGRTDLVDTEGRPVRPRDLTSGSYKGDPRPAALYRRIITGMPGTPMPGNDWAYGDDAWYLVRYLERLAPGPR